MSAWCPGQVDWGLGRCRCTRRRIHAARYRWRLRVGFRCCCRAVQVQWSSSRWRCDSCWQGLARRRRIRDCSREDVRDFSGFQVLSSGDIAGSGSEPDGALRLLSTGQCGCRGCTQRCVRCGLPSGRFFLWEIFLSGFVWEGMLSCDDAMGRDVDVLGILRCAAEPE